MGQAFVIPSIFQAIDKMSPVMAVMTHSMDRFTNHAETAFAKSERGFRKLVEPANRVYKTFNNMMGGLGAPVGLAALGYGLKGTADIFIDFEAANANVAAALDATAKQIVPLTVDAKRLGSATKFTAEQVSGLQFEYAKLGFAPDQILKMTESTLSLAAATKFDLGPAATTVGSALRAFGLEADQTGRVTDVLAAAASKTALDMNDFFENLSTFAPVAKAFNFSLEESVALFGKIRDSGFDASSAATALRNIFLNLADGNGKLARALGKPAANIKELIGGMVTLRKSGIDLATMLEITDKRSVAAFATLLDNAEAVGKLNVELKNSTGFAKKMADTQMNTVGGSLKLVTTAWQGLVLSIEDGTGRLAHGIRTVSDVIAEMFHIWSGTEKANKNLKGNEIEIRNTAETMLNLANMVFYGLGALALFKGGLIAVNGVLWLTKGITAAANLVMDAFFLVDMIKYVAVTNGLSFSTAALTIVQESLNAAMLANPIGLIIGAIVVATVVTWGLIHANESARAEYERMSDLNISKHYTEEAGVLETLISKYEKLGKSTKEATEAAIQFERTNLQMSMLKLDSELSALHTELESHQINLGVYGTMNLPGADAIRDKINAKQLIKTGLMSENRQITDFALAHNVNAVDTAPPKSPTAAPRAYSPYDPAPIKNEWMIMIKNQSDSAISVDKAGKKLEVQPQTESTTHFKK